MMTYFNLIVAISCGLAITILVAVLTDKSYWKTWADSIRSLRFKNENSYFSSDPSAEVANEKVEESDEIITELGEHMATFQLRNRFYKDGRFHMP